MPRIELQLGNKNDNALTNTLVQMILLVIYRFLLDVMYTQWIVPNYRYYGFQYSYAFRCAILSWCGTIVFGIVGINLFKRGKATDTIIGLLILLYYYPMCSLCMNSNNDLTYFLFANLYFFLLVLCNNIVKIPDITRRLSARSKLFDILIVIMGLMMVGISGVFTGFRISFDLSEYYELRTEAAMYSMPTIISFAFYWGLNLIPVGLSYALINKKRVMIVFCLIAQALAFSFNGKKSVLFIMFLMIGISIFYKNEYRKHIPLYFSLVAIASYVESIIRGTNSFLVKYFIRRLMFIPAFLGEKYYEYFSAHEFDYLRSSILRRIGLISPYSNGIPKTMGQYIYGNSTNANTGLCGDAFANFGWVSLLFYPLLIILTFKILERLMDQVDQRLVFAVCFTVSYTFLSGSYFTNLLTNGFIILCLLMAICPRKVTETYV